MPVHTPSNVRAFVRRAFPYLVIALVGFALAYVIVFIFVLPSKLVPPKAPGRTLVSDSSNKAGIPPIAAPGESLPTTAGTTFVAPPVMPAPPITQPPALVTIPDFTGMALSDAQEIATDLQLRVTTRTDTSSLQPENTVLRQRPVAGEEVAPGSVVALVITRFPPEQAQESTSAPVRTPTPVMPPTPPPIPVPSAPPTPTPRTQAPPPDPTPALPADSTSPSPPDTTAPPPPTSGAVPTPAGSSTTPHPARL